MPGGQYVITVDGEAVMQADSDDPEHILANVRTELKLCKALLALDPPYDVAVSLYARITDILRVLKRHGQRDAGTPVAELSDEELASARDLLRAIRAVTPERQLTGNTGFRVVLSEYTLAVVDETEKLTSGSRPGREHRDRAGDDHR
jgi:hypothetical protein